MAGSYVQITEEDLSPRLKSALTYRRLLTSGDWTELTDRVFDKFTETNGNA